MSHYAKVLNGLVLNVIVAEPDFFESFVDASPGQWIKTSYNTHGGVHSLGGEPLRKNFAGVGFTYDEKRDAFIPPKTFDSWSLNEETCLWEPPVPMPEGSFYWDEQNKRWIEIEKEQV